MSQPDAGERARPRRTTLAATLLGAPTAWAVHLAASYLIVPESCRAGTTVWMHAVTLVTFAGAAAATAMAWRLLRDATGDTTNRFLGGVGLAAGLLFTAAVLVQGLPVLLVDPCT